MSDTSQGPNSSLGISILNRTSPGFLLYTCQLYHSLSLCPEQERKLCHSGARIHQPTATLYQTPPLFPLTGREILAPPLSLNEAHTT